MGDRVRWPLLAEYVLAQDGNAARTMVDVPEEERVTASPESRPNLLPGVAENWRPPRYVRLSSRWQKVRATFLRFLDLQSGTIWRDLARLLPGERGQILDVGCGMQPYRSLIGREASYVGIDVSGAEKDFGFQSPDTTYYAGDRWPVDSGSVDCVLCVETLEHVKDSRGFVAEISRALRPGGRVILTVPFCARWHFIPHDYWRFTPSGFAALFADSGLTDLKVWARGNQLTVACYKVMALVFSLLSKGKRRLLRALLGILSLPVFFLALVLANLSLRVPGTVDCIGYTVLARKEPFDRPVSLY